MEYFKKILISVILAVLFLIFNIFMFTIIGEYLSDASDVSVLIGVIVGISLAVIDYYIIKFLYNKEF